MAHDLAEVIRGQHAELRDLLAHLARQPRVTEQTLQPQLRARDHALADVQRVFLAHQGARLRHLWPALRRIPDTGDYVARALQETRAVEHCLAKRRWYGDRDETANELDDQIASGIETHLEMEERELARLAESGRLAALDTAELARLLARDGLWPTRPHPDVPRSPRLAVLLQRPLALTDRVVDRLALAT